MSAHLPGTLAVFGLVVIVASLINAVFVRLANRVVTGATPDYRAAFVAAFGSHGCFIVAGALTGGVGAALGYRMNPEMFAIIMVMGVLLTLCLYAQVLQDDRSDSIGMSRALAVFVLQVVVSSLVWLGVELLFHPGRPLDLSARVAAWFPASGAKVADAQRLAVKTYPELGIAGSRLNAEFIRRYRRYQREQPALFRDASWPLQLAQEAHQAVYGRYLSGGVSQGRMAGR
jgi:hypothetical protein